MAAYCRRQQPDDVAATRVLFRDLDGSSVQIRLPVVADDRAPGCLRDDFLHERPALAAVGSNVSERISCDWAVSRIGTGGARRRKSKNRHNECDQNLPTATTHTLSDASQAGNPRHEGR
jgi:hypothetical protein